MRSRALIGLTGRAGHDEVNHHNGERGQRHRHRNKGARPPDHCWETHLSVPNRFGLTRIEGTGKPRSALSALRRWSAVFPELPGCASAGDTEEEAVANAKEALALWFEPADVPLQGVLIERLAGPFEPLESDWKERVRQYDEIVVRLERHAAVMAEAPASSRNVAVNAGV